MPTLENLKGLTWAGTTALYLVALDLIAAIGVVAWQALNWMRTDEWQSLTVLTGLASFDVLWATEPDSWLGIHKLLQHVPLSMAVFWAGMLPALLLMLLHNRLVGQATNLPR